jgi:iron-sulfur cluster assembly protein
MIIISNKARKMLKKQGLSGDAFVRILVKTGGCAGMTYEAEIAEVMWPGEDIAFQDNEVTIISDRESMEFLNGLKIDYSDDLISAGYRFRNDTNESSCGCGASFALAGYPASEHGGASCDC